MKTRRKVQRIIDRNIANKLENGEEITEDDTRSVDDILADEGDRKYHEKAENGGMDENA